MLFIRIIHLQTLSNYAMTIWHGRFPANRIMKKYRVERKNSRKLMAKIYFNKTRYIKK